MQRKYSEFEYSYILRDEDALNFEHVGTNRFIIVNAKIISNPTFISVFKNSFLKFRLMNVFQDIFE